MSKVPVRIIYLMVLSMLPSVIFQNDTAYMLTAIILVPLFVIFIVTSFLSIFFK